MGGKAPFPYFGGKSAIAPLIWERLGDPANFVDPFMGSNALLLARPQWDWQADKWKDEMSRIETVNDADGFVSNAWRAIHADPQAVARYADWPVFENDLHARHVWLRERRSELVERLEGDPDYFDAKIAGWWLWGMACWIGGGFCGDSSAGPWQVHEDRLVHLGNAGRGVKRARVHLGNAGRGVCRRLVRLGDAGQGNAEDGSQGLYAWMEALSRRLRRVRVCCGDWSRVMGPMPTTKLGTTGVFLDPPYAQTAGRDMRLYAVEDGEVAHAVRQWCLAQGDDPRLRIALCGYEGEHEALEAAGWSVVCWKTRGGYGSLGEGTGRDNAPRERVWFSPHCLRPEDTSARNLTLDWEDEEE